MNATTVAVDLAKNDFELAIAGIEGQAIERRRLSRLAFSRFFLNRSPCHVVMEACGSAHHWGRMFTALGHSVQLLPAQYVRAYVRRNKTDRADASALLEAARCQDIQSVPIKTEAQQLILQLHRIRAQWMRSRTARINGLRGCLREFGLAVPVGARRGLDRVREQLALTDRAIPPALQPVLSEVLSEIRELDARVLGCERQLAALTREDPVVRRQTHWNQRSRSRRSHRENTDANVQARIATEIIQMPQKIASKFSQPTFSTADTYQGTARDSIRPKPNVTRPVAIAKKDSREFGIAENSR